MYEEIKVPAKSLYKCVGYNDMQRVKIIMEGDDSDKRSSLQRKNEEEGLIARSSTVKRIDAKSAEQEAREEENRRT